MNVLFHGVCVCPQEEYPGLGPFSEPEVQMLHTIASRFRPHVWLNIHSGMEAMFTPYDHQALVSTFETMKDRTLGFVAQG